MQIPRLLILCFFLGFIQPSLALVIDASVEKKNLLSNVEIFVDRSQRIQAHDIISDPSRFSFESTAHLTSEINFGFSNATYWIKIPLATKLPKPSEWILELPYLGLDTVDFYAPGKSVVQSGANALVADRPFRYRYYTFPLTLTQDIQYFYLKVESKYTITIPLVLYSLSEFNNEQISDTLIQALYYGGLLSLFFYNLILFISIRDRQNLVYCCFTAFTGLAVFAGNGYGRLYLWNNLAAWDQISQSVLFGFAGFFGLLFTSLFLKTKEQQPKLHFVLTLFGLIYLSLTAALLLTLHTEQISREVIFKCIFINSLIAALACIYGSFAAIRLGQGSAYYFAMAWGALALGVIAGSLRAFGLIPSNGLTLYAVQIGSGLEMLLFSFALAFRIQSERTLREQAQFEALGAKQAAIDEMKKSEDRLEKAVEQRTEKLQHLLLSEQEVHNQYVRFGAMIAHEFRNPLNIIEGQTSMLELESEVGINKTQKRTAAIRSATSRLASLFDQWLQSDRLNQSGGHLEISMIDLTAMANTLAETSRTFHADYRINYICPSEPIFIPCDSNLLQIAILNLIDNACKYSEKGSAITLNILNSDNEVGIQVCDTGCGIDPQDLEKIFDVYYRGTHSVEVKGTGLGLAFVKRIAELHNGRVEMESQLAIGSIFTIWLPLQQA